MDLLKQQQEFLKRQAKAIDTAPRPSASSSHTTYVPVANRQATKRKKTAAESAKAQQAESARAAGTDAASFGTMAQIVDFMKKRHLEQRTWALTLEEIIEEMQLEALPKKTRDWLQQALPNNPRLQAQSDDNERVKFAYKPPYRLKNKASIINLLKKYHHDGKGAILLSELNDCIANAAKVMETMGSEVIDIPTQVNKRRDHAYFYNDPETNYKIDNEFTELWRTTNVDNLDENKIAEYLQKHGITSVKNLAPQRPTTIPKRKQNKRRANVKVQNVHLEGVLQEYDAGN